VAELRFLPAAQADYEEALAWYQARSVRAADGFEAAVAQGVQRISDRQGTSSYPEEACLKGVSPQPARAMKRRFMKFPGKAFWRQLGGSLLVGLVVGPPLDIACQLLVFRGDIDRTYPPVFGFVAGALVIFSFWNRLKWRRRQLALALGGAEDA